VEVLAIAYIGGRGSLWGGIPVAFLFVFIIEFLRSNLTELPGLQLVIYGVLMVLVMIYYPAGFTGFFYWVKGKVLKLFSKSKASDYEADLSANQRDLSKYS
jgi:hypothetical protein